MRISFSPSDLTGAIDMSSELQATIDFLQNKKGGVISLPAGFIKLNAGVDITKGGITFVGCGWEDYRGYHGQFRTLATQRPTQGSYIVQDTSIGSAFRVANTANHVEFHDMAFIQGQPDDAPGWVPAVYEACIHFTNTGTSGGTGHVENCLFWGVYSGVRLGHPSGNCGAVSGNKVYGICFNYCWMVENAVDTVRLTNFHFWNGFIAYLTNMQSYCFDNATAIALYRCDNPQLSNGICLGFKQGILFDTNATDISLGGSGITANAKLVNIDLDGNVYGIRSIANGVTLEAANVTTNGAVPGKTGTYGFYITDTAGTYVFSNLKVANTGLNGIKLTGGGSSLAISNLRIIGYNQDNSAATTNYAVTGVSGDTISIGGEFVTSGGGSSAATGGAATFLSAPMVTVGQLPGTTTNDDASAGNVGELISAVATAGVATVTITVASPAVVSWTSHGLALGSPVVFITTGALPAGLSANTVYWVIPIGTNSFRLATSPANAIAGTAINTSGSQSGTHTASSSVPLSLNVAANVAFIDLTAGNWDVNATAIFIPGGTTRVNYGQGSISQTGNTLDTTVGRRTFVAFQSGPATVPFTHFSTQPGPIRMKLSSTTVVYLVAQSDFDTGTLAAYGTIRATRVR